MKVILLEDVKSQGKKREIIDVEHIKWFEDEMLDWCDGYSSKRNDTTVTEWCNNFKNNYNSLDKERKEIFFTPIILYICCHENVDVLQDSTIVEIYDKAFRNIVTKEYENVELQQETGLSAVDGAVVMWQLIKELAYQMYLNDKLDSGAGTELIQKAKNRVKAIKEDISLTDETLSKMLKKLPTIFHFATENNDGGYEFAHKTVAEYFTAVKLYEDYFAQYNKDYLSQYENDYFTKYDKDYLDETKLKEKEKEEIKEKVAELWQSFVEVFRYKELPEDIRKDYKLVLVGKKGWFYEEIFAKEVYFLISYFLLIIFLPVKPIVYYLEIIYVHSSIVLLPVLFLYNNNYYPNNFLNISLHLYYSHII